MTDALTNYINDISWVKIFLTPEQYTFHSDTRPAISNYLAACYELNIKFHLNEICKKNTSFIIYNRVKTIPRIKNNLENG